MFSPVYAAYSWRLCFRPFQVWFSFRPEAGQPLPVVAWDFQAYILALLDEFRDQSSLRSPEDNFGDRGGLVRITLHCRVLAGGGTVKLGSAGRIIKFPASSWSGGSGRESEV